MRKNQTVIVILVLAVLTFAAYWRILGNGFIKYDDDDYVYANTHIQQGITPQSLKWAFNVGYACNWHPITWMSHMVDYSVFGAKPMGHHLISLLLHILNAVLLLLVLRRLTGSLWKSAFVAALFALHPLHVESVAWAAERKDVLSATFWFLTMGAYALYAEKPGLKRYLPVVGLYALGLMAKPMLVTLPLVLLLLDYWPLRRFKKEKRGKSNALSLVVEKLPLLVLAAGSSVLTMTAQIRGQATSDLAVLTMGMRISNALVSYAAYIEKMLWPTRLAIFYPHPKDSLSVLSIVGSVILLIGLSVVVFRAARKRPYLGFGWLWYLVTLAPVIGVLQVGLQSMADRYTYIPLIGLFVIVSWGAADLFDRLPRLKALTPISACLIIVILAAATWVQVGYWHDSVSMFERAIDVTDGNFLAHLNLGWVLARQGKIDEAIEHSQAAVDIRPDWDMAYYNLGSQLAKRGDTEEAIDAYKEALRLNPDLTAAKVNLAGELAKAGRAQEALSLGGEGSTTSPGGAELHYNMGCVLEQQGKYAEAMKEYQEAVRLKPDFGQARNNLAVAYFFAGNYDKAWEEVYLARKYQTAVHPGFLQSLSQKMPDPGQ